MATISKESIAQFWLHAFPISKTDEYLAFSDSTIVQNLLQFPSEKNEEKKIFDIIHSYIQEVNPRKLVQTITIKTSPKRRRSARNTLTNIDANRLRFTINIEVIENVGDDEEIPTTMDTEVKQEDRTIENVSSILHETDSKIISQRFHTLIYPWLIDVSFTISNELFTIIVELMNKFPGEFFLHCFVPWLNHHSLDNLHFFCSNLFTQLTNPSDRCQLCTYLCENSTTPLNHNELSLISKWFDSKEFHFSNDLFNILPEKIAISAKIFSDYLPFAKVLHKILIKCTENQWMLTNDQRCLLKQAITINTTILSDILMDLLD